MMRDEAKIIREAATRFPAIREAGFRVNAPKKTARS